MKNVRKSDKKQTLQKEMQDALVFKKKNVASAQNEVKCYDRKGRF